jgi:hypothetical protein
MDETMLNENSTGANPYGHREKLLTLGLFVLFLALGLMGSIFKWYKDFAWFDETLHFFTLLTATLLIVMEAYGRTFIGATRHQFLLFVLIVLTGLGIGAMWEIWEWIYDQIFTQKNTIKGKLDTIIDLVIDTAGAAVAGFIAIRLANRKQ